MDTVASSKDGRKNSVTKVYSPCESLNMFKPSLDEYQFSAPFPIILEL